MPQSTYAIHRKSLVPVVYLERFRVITDANMNGIITMRFEVTEPDQWWRVERIALRTSGSTTDPEEVARVYVSSRQTIEEDAFEDTALRDGIACGREAYADYTTPIWVPPASRLSVRWIGGSAGYSATGVLVGWVCQEQQVDLPSSVPGPLEVTGLAV